jgi:hypothetical protein
MLVMSAGYTYTPTYSGYDSTGTGISSARPDAVCNDQEQNNPTSWFNRDCYRIPSTTGDTTGQPLGRFGNASRGSLRGPGYWLADSGVYKDFPLNFGHRDNPARLRFSFLTRNTFNHPAQGGLFGCNTNISSGGFGTCPKGATPPYWAGYREVWLTTQFVF